MDKKQIEFANIESKKTFIQPGGYEKHSYADPTFPIFFHTDVKYETAYAQNPMFSENFIPHWHENIEILRIKEGTAQVSLDGKNCIYEKNEIAIINSGVFHKVDSVSKKVIYDCLIIDSDFLKNNGIDIENCSFEEKLTDKTLFKYIDNLSEFFYKRTALYKTKCLACVSLIGARIYEYHRVSSNMHTSRNEAAFLICRGIMKYIYENFESKIDIDEIAKTLGVSKFHMCRCFKKYTGCSIVEFINIYRVERAKKLIAFQNMNVSEAAMRCGFLNMSYFTRVFKKHNLIAPGEYKKQIKEKNK